MPNFPLLNGASPNLLGPSEPEVYSATRLYDIESRCNTLAKQLDHKLSGYQSNAEHDLTVTVQQAAGHGIDVIIRNLRAFKHTGIALRDALLAAQIPFIEVHPGNTFAREEFRHNSYFSNTAQSCLFGFGAYGYELTLQAADRFVANAREK